MRNYIKLIGKDEMFEFHKLQNETYSEGLFVSVEGISSSTK